MIFTNNCFFQPVTLVVTILFALTTASWAQGTAFTYQSRLNDNGPLANGNYDLQFSLFDAINGGAQIGATLNKSGIAIANGVFIVQLDFGANAFTNGGQRFLQIADLAFHGAWGEGYQLGPGTIRVAHTSEERIGKAELLHGVDLYVKLATDLLARPRT